tara:strand:+ start:1578 stop:2513 length:936 start_codon:yes stop_codon:yes gene_type:complete
MNTTLIPQAQVFLNNTCSLKCNFCMNKHIKNESSDYPWPWENKDDNLKVGRIDDIKKYIDYLVEMGVRRIELGTTIGEPLEHNIDDLNEIFRYLEVNPNIESYFFYTNLTQLKDDHIVIFNRYQKLQIKISCYGLSSKQFKLQTGYELWKRFKTNLKKLGKVKRKMKILLALRAPIKNDEQRLNWLKLKAISIKSHHDIVFEETAIHFNWKDTIDFEKIKNQKPNQHKGHCGMIYTDCGILGNGDFTICAWLDVYGDGKVGNVFKNTPKEMLLLREKIIDDQNNGIFNNICKYCKFYVPANLEKADQAGTI